MEQAHEQMLQAQADADAHWQAQQAAAGSHSPNRGFQRGFHGLPPANSKNFWDSPVFADINPATVPYVGTDERRRLRQRGANVRKRRASELSGAPEHGDAGEGKAPHPLSRREQGALNDTSDGMALASDGAAQVRRAEAQRLGRQVEAAVKGTPQVQRQAERGDVGYLLSGAEKERANKRAGYVYKDEIRAKKLAKKKGKKSKGSGSAAADAAEGSVDPSGSATQQQAEREIAVREAAERQHDEALRVPVSGGARSPGLYPGGGSGDGHHLSNVEAPAKLPVLPLVPDTRRAAAAKQVRRGRSQEQKRRMHMETVRSLSRERQSERVVEDTVDAVLQKVVRGSPSGSVSNSAKASPVDGKKKGSPSSPKNKQAAKKKKSGAKEQASKRDDFFIYRYTPQPEGLTASGNIRLRNSKPNYNLVPGGAITGATNPGDPAYVPQTQVGSAVRRRSPDEDYDYFYDERGHFHRVEAYDSYYNYDFPSGSPNGSAASPGQNNPSTMLSQASAALLASTGGPASLSTRAAGRRVPLGGSADIAHGAALGGVSGGGDVGLGRPGRNLRTTDTTKVYRGRVKYYQDEHRNEQYAQNKKRVGSLVNMYVLPKLNP